MIFDQDFCGRWGAGSDFVEGGGWGQILYKVGGGVRLCTKRETGLVHHFTCSGHKSIQAPI